MNDSKFSLKDRIKSFGYAFQGLVAFFKECHNAWIHLTATVLVVFLGIYLELSTAEWLWIISAIVLVFITEMINTAIEQTVNLASAEIHPLAKKAKDIAAAAVLIAAIYAIVIGLIVLIPYFL